MHRNPPGKETSKRVGSAAGRLLRLPRRGKFIWFNSRKLGAQIDVTEDVRAVLASALVQRQLPKKPRRGKGKARRRHARGETIRG